MFVRRRDFLSLSAFWSAWTLAHGSWPTAVLSSHADTDLARSSPQSPARADASGDLSPAYAESFMFDSASADGTREVSVRLARFPPKKVGSLWVMACIADEVYSLVDEDLDLGSFIGRAPVEQQRVAVDVAGRATASVERTTKDGMLTALVRAAAPAHPTMEPPLGPGRLPISVEARFEAWHQTAEVRPGRTELMGSVRATVRTPGGVHEINAPGNWHEQVGPRPQFAPAFTYLNTQGTALGLLAIRGPNNVFGYAWLKDRRVEVREFTIDPVGPQRRIVRAVLSDGQVIEGDAAVQRRNSMPVEGQRRPGSTVILTTNVGKMSGHLNDWQPGAR